MSENVSLNVEIRRLWPSDMEAYRDHLLRLDAHSRHERFGGGMSDDFLVHYAERCFGQGDLLYGAFVDGHLCGAAELRSNEAIWSEQARASHSRRGSVLGRKRIPPPRHRREAVQAHPARRDQPWRRDDRDHLPAGQHRDADAGAEVQDAFHFRGERADRTPPRVASDRVFAAPIA